MKIDPIGFGAGTQIQSCQPLPFNHRSGQSGKNGFCGFFFKIGFLWVHLLFLSDYYSKWAKNCPPSSQKGVDFELVLRNRSFGYLGLEIFGSGYLC